MNSIEKFKYIYLNYKIKELIPFLKELTSKDKKEIVSLLKKKVNKGWGTNNIITLTALACCTKEEYKKLLLFSGNDLSNSAINDLFAWYCPGWLSEYLDETNWNRSYSLLMEWKSKGYVQPTEKTIAISLAGIFIDNREKTPQELFVQYPEILESQIWLLFQYPNYNLCREDFLFERKKSTVNRSWIAVFLELEQNKQINRARLIKESLQAIGKPFEKEPIHWFINLFNLLQPSEEEQIKLQPDIFPLLIHEQNKQVTFASNICKKLCTHPQFEDQEFISCLPVLFSSSVKNILNSSLMICEKLLKKEKKNEVEICSQIPAVFLIRDEATQTKAAKILVKYLNSNQQSVKEAIIPYQDTIFSTVKDLLSDFLDLEEKTVSESITIERTETFVHIREDNRLQEPKTLEDFIFFSTSAFSNTETYYFDFFLSGLIRFHEELKRAGSEKLDPIFKKAYECIVKPSFKIGILDNLLACFFLDYAQSLQLKSEWLQKAKNHVIPFPQWIDKKSGTQNSSLVYKGLHQMLTEVLQLLKNGSKLPLLSTPTHFPGWIDPCILIGKIKEYEKEGKLPLYLDMQLALLRTCKENLKESREVTRELSPEYAGLLEPLFSEFYGETPPDEYKNNNLSWEIGIQNQKKWSWGGEKKEAEIISYPKIKIHVYKKLSSELTDTPTFLEYILNTEYVVWSNDVKRIMLYIPYLSDFILGSRINDSMNTPQEQYDTKGVITTMEALLQLQLPFKEIHYVFTALGMIHADKTVRNYAAELWINGVTYNLLDSYKLGETIGKIEKWEFAPLKRFTDLLLQSLINISLLHNYKLEELIEGIVISVEKPVKNIKKLLEIYREILVINQSKIKEELIPVLNEWENEKILTTVIRLLHTR